MVRGFWHKSTRIKEDAAPIDNVTKHAWDEADFEEYEEWVEYSDAESNALDLEEAKDNLAKTDYITAKAIDALLCCENLGALLATLAAFYREYHDVLVKRAEWRKRVNELEQLVKAAPRGVNEEA